MCVRSQNKLIHRFAGEKKKRVVLVDISLVIEKLEYDTEKCSTAHVL